MAFQEKSESFGFTAGAKQRGVGVLGSSFNGSKRVHWVPPFHETLKAWTTVNRELRASQRTRRVWDSQLPQKPGGGKSRPALERRRWAPAALLTGHAQGVDLLVGTRNSDESGSACARPSARELVLFRVLRLGTAPTEHP